MKALLGVGGPLLMAVVWGTFIAPKAAFEVPTVAWLGVQAVLFGAAAAALATLTSPAVASTFYSSWSPTARSWARSAPSPDRSVGVWG